MPGDTLELIQSRVVRAGAGAGKTRRLTKEVMEFASLYHARAGRLPRVAVTTFTRKATEELRERLLHEAVKSGRPELLEFVTSPSYLTISTIHGILSLFLRKFGQWLGVDPNFTVIEGAELRHQSSRILRRVLGDSTELQSLLESFSVSELVDVLEDLADLKTRSSQTRPATLTDFEEVLEHVKSEHARAMDEFLSMFASVDALATLTGPLKALRDWFTSTPAAKVHEEKGFFGEFYPQLPRYSAKWGIEKEAYAEARAFFKDTLGFWSTPAADPSVFETYRMAAERVQTLADVFLPQLHEYKARTGQMTMGDLESVSGEAVARHPQVARAFAIEWDYWLIDEFQDTSPFQISLLDALIGDRPRFVVGDPQQSIYLFRGARYEVFDKFQTALIENGGSYEELPVNYRSSPELLEFFNDFFTQLDGRFRRMQTREPVTNPEGNVASFVTAADDDPFGHVADHILNGLASGQRAGDYCILARTNDELFAAAMALERAGLSTFMHASDGYFERRETLDLLSLLKFILNPHDNVNFVRLFRSPWLRIPDEKLAKIAAESQFSYWRTADTDYADEPAVQKAREILTLYRTVGAAEAVRLAVMDLKMIEFAHYHDSTGRREANIWKFISLISEKSRSPGFNFLQFVDRALESWLSVDGDDETDAVAATEPNRVQMMTIHKSKGLSFKHVILLNAHKTPGTTARRRHKEFFVHVEDKGLWSVALRDPVAGKVSHSIVAEEHFKKLKEREHQESLRLLYVALTRATESVLIHHREKAGKDSWLEKMRWNLEQGEHRRENYMYSVFAERKRAAVAARSVSATVTVRAPWRSVEEEKTRGRRISVTRLLEGDQRGAPVVHSVDHAELSERLLKPVRGTKIHEAFERIRLSGDFDAAAYLRAWFGDSAEQYAGWIAELSALTEPPLVELLKTGEVEWGFQWRAPWGIVEGQIDLWGIADGTVWVIDYKTGNSKFAQKALDQLQIYAHALRNHLKEDLPIKVAALFAADGRVAVADALTPDEVETKFQL